MRYDLEVNITGQLTQDGLSVLADMFYNKDEDLITPIRWDGNLLSPEPAITSPGMDTSKFNHFRNVKDTAFVSGVASQESVSIFKMLIRENIICPIFTGGDLLFYRYKYRWSNNNIVKLTEWDAYQHAYICEVDDDIDEYTAQVFTLKLASPGYLGYNREFSFVNYDNIEIKKIQKKDLPSKSRRDVIYCCMDTNEVYEVEESSANTYKTFDITHVQNTLPVLPTLADRWCVVGLDSDFIYFHNGYEWINIHAARAFATSEEDYKFVIYSDPLRDNKKVILTNSKKISYTNLRVGASPHAERVLVGMPEFPVKDLSVVGLTTDNTEDKHYELLTSALLVTNKTEVDMDVVATFDAYPLVTYQQKGRSNREDTVYRNINLTPSAIKFKNGLVCVYNTFSPTIPTNYGAYLPIPIQLTMSMDKSEISALEGIKITAKLSGLDGIPIKGAKIKFNLYQEEDAPMAQWMGSGENTFESFTGVDGTADAIMLQKAAKYGFFIQKSWVHDNIIDVPFDIGITNPKRVYLYIITADDPILGKLGAKSSIGELPVSDYYQRSGRLDSYELKGRRMAYVSMNTKYTASSRILQSSYIKPVAMMKFTDKKMVIKDLFIHTFREAKKTILDTNEGLNFTEIPGVNAFTELASGWNPEFLPEAALDADGKYIPSTLKARYKEVNVKNGVTIVYPDNIPGTSGLEQDSRIVGYWLATGSGGNVDVDCVFENEAMSLYSDRTTINVTNYIKSEQEFVISEIELNNQNAVLGAFGYYTISEFINNPYNMGANTYCCVHSDPVTHSCINKASIDFVDKTTGITKPKKISSYYKLDSVNSTTCIHSPTYDATLIPEERCPGLDAHYVNPFILHVQK